ncbi:MAG: UvrD-helicase domain-containing protein, partial [Deltaproteobacteria bacterium]|nr:UvrD-helicase domain-containing protein [Deltaproteobacteria bacterium]
MSVTEDNGIRERAGNDLKQSFIVEAGAGTGKTTVLISRILGAVITGKTDLERIVAITFTEKAAGEMKVRLRFELEQALRRLDGEEWRRARNALTDIERAQVATIHSFCAALLRERPVEAKVEPAFEVLDELGANLLIDRTWEEWLSAEMEQGPPPLLELLRSGIRLDEIHKVGKFLLHHRDILGKVPPPVSEEVEEFFRLFTDDLQKLNELQSACKDPADRAFIQVVSLNKSSEKLSGMGPEGQRDFLLSHLEIRPAAGNQKNWHSKENLTEAKRLFGKIREGQEKVSAAIRHNQAVGLLKWLNGFVERYEQAKSAEGCLDFFDLLYRCRELLKNNKRVRGYFQQRFDSILVDEFQDTDPLQIEILFFLAEKSPRAERWQQVDLRPGKLFLVGDPKQSIYRFRRADIEAYHEAKGIIARQGKLLALTLNFRSRPMVVGWINALFSRLIRPPDEGAYQPAYQPITASRTGREGPCVLVLPPAPQISVEDGSASKLRMAEARTVAALLKRIMAEGWFVWDQREGEKRKIGYGDVGILFRAKEAIDLYEEEFRDFEIPYRVAGGRRYYSRLEMGALAAILSSLDNPKDAVALTAALRSPFFGVSDEELFIFVQEGYPLDFLALGDVTGRLPKSIREAARCLRELYDLRNDVNVSLFLLKIYEATRILPLLYLKPQGDQKVANLLKMVELARGLEKRGLTTLRSFVQFLKKMEVTEAEEGESPLAEESEDAARIMTIHKAKGLEFPLVILADAAYEGRHRIGRGVVNRSQGRLEICIGSPQRGIMTQGWQETRERERLREEAEDYRLLYVAATRARDYLVIPFLPGNEKKRFLGPLWKNLEIGEDIPWGKEVYPESGPGVMVVDSRTLDTEKRELRPFRAGLDFKKPETGDRRTEPSRIRYQLWEHHRQGIRDKGRLGRKVLAATAVAKPKDEEIRASGLGAAFGSFVHGIFRAIDFHRPEGLRAIARALGGEHGLDEATVERGIRLVEWGFSSNVLRRAVRSSLLWKELPFVYRHRDDLVEGFIDLASEEDGEIVVVDFKTDMVENGKELEE